MSRQEVVIVQEFTRPASEIFARLADHNQLGPILGVPVRRIRDGDKSPNGVGSVRRVGGGPLALEETVVDLVQNKSIDYEITRGGGPVRNHHGSLQFSSTSGGSRVRWTIVFDTPVPLLGPLVGAVLRGAIGRGLKRLA